MSDPFYFNPSQGTTNNLTQDKADTLYLIKTGGTDNLNSNVNINAGLNINSNLLTNSLSITPVELSYLDGVSSNLQQQINNISGGGASSNIGTLSTNTNPISNNDTLNVFASKTNTQLTNLSTINTNNGITSSTNIIDNINYLQSQINNLPNGSGSGVSYFLTNATSTINNQYLTISNIPANSTNQILTTGTITSTTPQQLMGQFITDTALNITQIPAGIWDFNFYANITNNNLSSYLIVEVYKYNGSATLLFTMTGEDINSTPIIPYNINATQPQFTVLTTDYLMIIIYGKTTSSQNVIINVDYNSSNYYSHFHLPSIQRQNHNDLLNIQGGTTNDYQHLTTQQLNNINNASSINNNGYLSNTDFIIFNNKEPAITKNTAFNKDFETLATNIKMNGAQSVGSSLNIARSDHIHPSDTTKQDFINATTTSDYYRGDKQFVALNKAAVGLSNVDNTSDLNKPISTATQTALNLKQDFINSTTTNDYYRGDKTFQPLTKNTIGLSNVVNTNFTQGRNGVIYVNSLTGNDSNDGLSLLTSYQTITAALSNQYISSGYQLQINCGSYNENIIVNAQNLTIICVNGPEIGSLCNITGNLTISATSSSVRLIGLTINGNIIHSGACNLYIQNLNCNGNFTKSSNSYLSINNMICSNTSVISISGSGNCNIINGCNLGLSFTINNSGAIVVIQNCLNMANLILQAGVCSIFQTVIYGKSSVPAFNCCSVSGTASALYLNNCDLVDIVNSSPYIISVAANNFYSLRNVNMNFSGSTLNGTSIGRTLYFDNIASNGVDLVNLNSNQTLTNKSLTSPIITNNIIKSGTSKFITLIDSSDTLVNLNSNQLMTNKSFTALKLTDNFIKTSTNNTITFLDTNDTIVNLLSNQTISNKTMTNLTLSDDYIKTSLNRQVNIPNANDTLVNLNSVQTMTNKTLTDPILTNNIIKSSTNKFITLIDSSDTLVNLNSVQTMTNKNIALTDGSTCITQATTDNTTKLATTAYVKNLLATPNSYVNTTQATSASFSLTTTYQDIASITIPVAGTYELNMEVMGSADAAKSVFIILYNSTTSTEVVNSFMTINSINVGVRIVANASKLLIVENVAANTVFKIQAKCTSGGTNYIYNDATYGYTYLSYKLLGLTTNIPLSKEWGSIGSSPSVSFGDYIINVVSGSVVNLKKTTNTNMTISRNYFVSFTPFDGSYGSTTLTQNTNFNLITGIATLGADNLVCYGMFSDTVNTYEWKVLRISSSNFSLYVKQLI